MSDIYDPDNPINAPDTMHGIREWQDINQMYSQSGLPAVHRDDWGDITAMADAIEKLDAVSFPFDNNAVAQRLASCWVSKYVTHWSSIGERTVDNRYCPEYDDSDPATMTRLYVLAYPSGMKAYPLSDPTQWLQVAEDLLPLRLPFRTSLTTASGGQLCFANLTLACSEGARGYLAVKRGEYLCLFLICPACLDALHTVELDSDEYKGPRPWTDDRVADPEQYGVNKNPWSDERSALAPEDDDPWSL